MVEFLSKNIRDACRQQGKMYTVTTKTPKHLKFVESPDGPLDSFLTGQRVFRRLKPSSRLSFTSVDPEGEKEHRSGLAELNVFKKLGRKKWTMLNETDIKRTTTLVFSEEQYDSY